MSDPYYYQQQQPPQEKSQEEKILEKSRKWQQLQSKRYGEKRKFGKASFFFSYKHNE